MNSQHIYSTFQIRRNNLRDMSVVETKLNGSIAKPEGNGYANGHMNGNGITNGNKSNESKKNGVHTGMY